MPSMSDNLTLKIASWQDYKRFVGLCCVPTMPFPGGPCWTIGNDIGFIGYNYAYRNNGRRYNLFPQHRVAGKCIDVTWLNANVRQLNRVMVRPKYRGKGLATYLVGQTLPMVGVPLIECLTWSHLIRHILIRTGFVDHGITKTGKCHYYLWGQ